MEFGRLRAGRLQRFVRRRGSHTRTHELPCRHEALVELQKKVAALLGTPFENEKS
jgi:hypothetical protein